MDGLLRVYVEDSEEAVEAGDREVRFVSQAVDASHGSDAAFVLPEHALVLSAEVEQRKIAGTSADHNLVTNSKDDFLYNIFILA